MLKQLLFILITVAIVFILLEAGCIAFYSFSPHEAGSNDIPPPSETQYFIDHPTLGWIQYPGYNGFWKMNGVKFPCRINSVGMRDDEFSVKKPSGTIRIICLGDSITFGPGVPNEETYPKLTETVLNNKGLKDRVEVFNCGVGDYGIQQEVILLKEIGLWYKPDIVILGYYLNDGRGFVPRTVIKPNYRLMRILKKSRLVYYLDQIIFKYAIKFQYKWWDKNRFKWEALYETGTWKSDKKDLYNLIQLADRDWGTAWTRRGWKIVKSNLDSLVSLRDANKFRLVVLNFPVAVQIYSDFKDEYLMMPQKQMSEFCSRNDILYIDLAPHLEKYPMKEMFIDYCHYTREGLRLVAGVVAEELKNKIGGEVWNITNDFGGRN